jgi:hypothetical protein
MHASIFRPGMVQYELVAAFRSLPLRDLNLREFDTLFREVHRYQHEHNVSGLTQKRCTIAGVDIEWLDLVTPLHLTNDDIKSCQQSVQLTVDLWMEAARRLGAQLCRWGVECGDGEGRLVGHVAPWDVARAWRASVYESLDDEGLPVNLILSLDVGAPSEIGTSFEVVLYSVNLPVGSTD